MEEENDTVNSAQCLVQALETILEKAQSHPCFMHHSFETRDYDAICDEGGDCCDWTFVGIYADDALREFNATADNTSDIAFCPADGCKEDCE